MSRNHPHDVDDTVQAVFLPFVQKAKSLRVDDSKKKIDELLNALREKIQKMDAAPPGTYSIPLKR
jgi:hypothetical protein